MLLTLIKLCTVLAELFIYPYAFTVYVCVYSSKAKTQYVKNLQECLGRTKKQAEYEYFVYLHSSYRNNLYFHMMRKMPYQLRNDFIDSILDVTVSDKVKSYLASDKPVLVSALHHGFFYIGSKVTLELIRKFNNEKPLGLFFDSVEKAESNKIHMEFQDSLKLDLNIFHNNRKHLIQSIKMLKKGGVVTMFNDISYKDGAFIYTEFLEKFHVSMSGSAFLQSKSNASIVHPTLILSCNKLKVDFTNIIEAHELEQEDNLLTINNRISAQYQDTIMSTPYLWHYTNRLHTMASGYIPKTKLNAKQFLNSIPAEDSRYFDVCKNIIKQLN